MTFLEKMNRDVQVIPDRVKEIAEASYIGASKHYVSEIMKWNGKLYEVIYGIKHTMKGLWVQRLLVVPEKGPVLLRNCFWEWPGYGNPGFKETERPLKDSNSLNIKPFCGKAQVIIRSLEGTEKPATVTVAGQKVTIGIL